MSLWVINTHNHCLRLRVSVCVIVVVVFHSYTYTLFIYVSVLFVVVYIHVPSVSQPPISTSSIIRVLFFFLLVCSHPDCCPTSPLPSPSPYALVFYSYGGTLSFPSISQSVPKSPHNHHSYMIRNFVCVHLLSSLHSGKTECYISLDCQAPFFVIPDFRGIVHFLREF